MNILKFSLAVILVTSMTACETTTLSNASIDTMDKQQADFYQLLGKKGKIVFPEATAYVNYIDANTLYWKTIDKNGNEAEGREKMDYKAINNHTFFLNWIEKDGFTVSQIIDTKANTVTAYWSYQDDNSRRGKRSAMFVNGIFSFQ